MRNIIRIKYYTLRFFGKLFIIFLLLPLIYNYIPVHKGKSTFYLPSSSINTMINTLHENGYGVLKIDKWMLHFFKPPPKGWYTIHQIPKERFVFFEQLRRQKADTVRIKIYAGETSEELSQRVAKNLKLNHKKLLEEYRRQTKYLEGDILAGYYTIAKNADERTVMTALYTMSHERLSVFTKSKCATPDTPNELELKILLIIASIIQKETNNKHEMKLVSSVIHNRLGRGMKLQMDGTLNYGKFSHKPVTPKRIRKDRSYYNTYIYGGIPPAPLCTISMAALEAALHPKKTNYLYFMLNKKGRHNFASSYKQHVKNIKAFRHKKKKKDFNTTKAPTPSV